MAQSLLESIDKTSLQVNTDSLDISFGEILSMYNDGELEINPAYQRLFRWNQTQQSQFIESLLLGLPIPPIFVIETETRKYELIDGLQRISTYLHFTGNLKNHHKYKDADKLKLSNCDVVKGLNGLIIDELDNSLRIKLKRSYVKMYIIRKDSPGRIKYDMFKRLNTGGSLLEAQEIRNSTIRFLSTDFIDFIQKMAKDENFKRVISKVRPYQLERQFGDELVLRFFTLKNEEFMNSYRPVNKNTNDVTLADLMTKFAENVASQEINFDYEKEEASFKGVFHLLNLACGASCFSAAGASQFLAFYFEAITLGVSKNYKIIANQTPEQEKRIVEINRHKIFEQIQRLKKDEVFQRLSKNTKRQGVSGEDYLKVFFQRIDFAAQKLKF